MKIISIAGIERGDFAYYLAVLLSKQATVLLVDNSYDNDLYGAVSDYAFDAAYMVKQNITYMANKDFMPNQDSFYEYVILWHGMNISVKHLAMSDFVYVLTDYTPGCLNRLRIGIPDKELITRLFMRDATEYNKVSENTVAEYLEMSKDKISGVLAYDNKDYENYLALLYNGRQTFNKLTPNFYQSLKIVLCDILDISDKDAKKLIDKTKNKS